jgi:hypothetical protein
LTGTNYWEDDFIVSAADSVTVTGMAQKLPYVPLMDSFAEYAEDSWTYDGRFVNVIQA